MGLDKVVKGCDKSANTGRNAVDQGAQQHKLGFLVTWTKATIIVAPEFLGPGQASQELITVTFNPLRDLSIVSTNNHLNTPAMSTKAYRLTRLVQVITMQAILSIIRHSIAADGKGTQ
ncbi:hypothetical protein N7463_004370 [Penicillium fimorum]|uniref:Uncharacterized protein n=1 Tax=Penicillium fimorum TaxID=1882269 RepID=A0A9X0CA63_9EURO|nr:hypothetical protein N7463_004370 [Penicillium fimorum]